MKQRLFVSLAIALVLGCGMAWLLGFNFDQRGSGAGLTVLGVAVVWLLAVICPFWNE